MQIVFHTGVHGTDGDRMLKSLLNNRDWLLQNGVEVPTPAHFRAMFSDALLSLNGGAATPDMEAIMLDALLESDAPKRVICSSPSLFVPPHKAVLEQGFYPGAGARLVALANLFPTARIEFFIGMKNPATLLRVLLSQATNDDYASLMKGKRPEDLSWAEAIRGMTAALQGRHRLVLWCHEDVPLIWPELLRLISGAPPEVSLEGGLLYMDEVLKDGALARFLSDIAGRDQMTVTARRALQADYLAKHARPEALEEEVGLPGWTQDTVDAVTARYEADIAEIAVLPGVEFIMA